MAVQCDPRNRSSEENNLLTMWVVKNKTNKKNINNMNLSQDTVMN